VKAQELRVGSLHNRQNEVVKETPKTEDTVKAKPAAIPQAMPFKPSASVTKASDEKKDADTKEKEVLLASSEKIPAGAVASKPEPKKQIPHSNKPLLTEYKHNGKFDPVPLAGELNYYKHNKIKAKNKTYAAYAMAGKAYSATHKLELGELEHHIAEALNELPQQCRTIFQMSRFEELKYKEIAIHLGISVKTVENQMGKALKIMRVKLADFLPLVILWLVDKYL